MPKRLWQSVWALTLLVGVLQVAHAQPIAEKPKINVGDTWEYARKYTAPEGKTDTWSRTVVEVMPDDRLRVKLESGTAADYDGALNFMPEGNHEYARILAKYPMKVGDEWEISRRFPNPSALESGKAKVVGYESISVPAGTFQCFRVIAESAYVNKSYRQFRTWSRWYCPDVKWIAKETLETRTSGATGGTDMETSELVKFTPAK